MDISSDGRTVWVNNRGRCIARYCPISGEVWLDDRVVATTNEETWESWRSRVEERHGVSVPDRHKPSWAA